MRRDQLLSFGSYRLDPRTGQLWRGKQEVRLTWKAAAVLHYLVERSGRVVTKEELFAAVWPETVVSDMALTSCIQEVRQALHDDARKPRYIKTVHRRGFRFLPTVTAQPVPSSRFQVPSEQTGESGPRLGTLHVKRETPLVGRDAELQQLHHWLAQALSGKHQLVFVTGEPGIGKTALVDTLLTEVGAGIGEQESQKANGKWQKPVLSVVEGAKIETDPRSLMPVAWIARGQCIEHYGAGEAYLPVLEALGRLCREDSGKAIIPLLHQYAPSWLVQMPSLLSAAELEELQRRTAGVTRERMLRELAEALEVVTQQQPLVLVLEDLHWSDVSTLDLLSLLAHRQEPAGLLILGTYRPVEVLTREHPLKGIKQELQLHGQCTELALEFLTEEHVAEYLAQRFPSRDREGAEFPPLADARGSAGQGTLRQMARLIHQRTDGNPLFMVNVTNDLVERKVITKRDERWELSSEIEDVEISTPENLRQLIEQQIERVSVEERKVLETASVAGAEFSAAAVAAGADKAVEEVEQCCDVFVRREQFLRVRGTTEWPDGTIAARYGFVHALYQEVLYERISTSQRMRLHRQIGEREETGHGERAREIAAELAVHFERGRDYARAVQYLRDAGENAIRRSANAESVRHLTTALRLLKLLPDIPQRTEQELVLQTTLGLVLRATKGSVTPEVEQAYNRAWELCQRLGETPQLFPLLFNLRSFSVLRGDCQTGLAQAHHLFTLAQKSQDVAQLVAAHYSLGWTLSVMGNFVQGYKVFKQGATLYDPEEHRALAHTYGFDPGVTCRIWIARDLCFLGYPEQALQQIADGLTLAYGLSHPFSLCFALIFAGYIHYHRQEWELAQERAEAVITIATKHEFLHWLQYGQMLRGWALALQGQAKEGVAEIRRGLAAYRTAGSVGALTQFLADLAAAHMKTERPDEGLSALTEALTLVDKTGERWYEAELYRLKGELTLQKEFNVPGSTFQVTDPRPRNPDPQGEAEACFLKAVDIARQQQAKSWELRATISLARLWRQQDKRKQAHKMLSTIHNWFTEGFDTKDLQEAKALLENLV